MCDRIDLLRRIEEQNKIIEGLLCFIENNVTQACPYEINDQELEINWNKCKACETLHGQQRNCWLDYFKNYGEDDDNA